MSNASAIATYQPTPSPALSLMAIRIEQSFRNIILANNVSLEDAAKIATFVQHFLLPRIDLLVSNVAILDIDLDMIRQTIEEIAELGVDADEKDTALQSRVSKYAINLIDFSEEKNGRPPSDSYIVDLLQGMDAFASSADAFIQIRTIHDVAKQASVNKARAEYNAAFQTLINGYDVERAFNAYKPSPCSPTTVHPPSNIDTAEDTITIDTPGEASTTGQGAERTTRPRLILKLSWAGSTMKASQNTAATPQGAQTTVPGVSQMAMPSQPPTTTAITTTARPPTTRPRKTRRTKVPSTAWVSAERAILQANWANRAGKSRSQIEAEHLAATGIQRSYDGLRQQTNK